VVISEVVVLAILAIRVNTNLGTIHNPIAMGVLLGGILGGDILPVHIVHRVNIKLHLMLRVVIPVLRENINLITVGTDIV
tara:strand:- start:455 stop:694 length:240 start_codon:yes stop_codon:yes gene_type:complete